MFNQQPAERNPRWFVWSGLPAWLASSSVWQSCYAPASLPGTGYLVLDKSEGQISDWNYWFLRISQKGIFSPGMSGILLFSCEICIIFMLEMLESCFAPFEWMLCACIQRIQKQLAVLLTPHRVVNATFFDLADFYQFLGWPSFGFFLWTLELIAFLAEVSMACLVYHGWDIGTQDR